MGISEAMVTARMSSEKKLQAGKVLELLGTNPSQVINRLYDFIIEKGSLPFPTEEQHVTPTAEEIAKAKAWINYLSVPTDTTLSDFSLKEIKKRRLCD